MPQKTQTMTIRITPSVKDVLRLIAEKERRSISNMVEVMIIRHGEELGIREESENKSRRK